MNPNKIKLTQSEKDKCFELAIILASKHQINKDKDIVKDIYSNIVDLKIEIKREEYLESINNLNRNK